MINKKNISESEVELCYLWIKKDKMIYEQGFNLSSRYRFDFRYSNEKKSKIIIEVRENMNYIDNFFSDNILNISAIVGRNGCGKSTLLNHINYKALDLFDNDNIVIFRKDNKFFVFTERKVEVIFCMANYETEKSDFITEYYTYNDIYTKDGSDIIFNGQLGGVCFITFSNIFTDNETSQVTDRFPYSLNVSTNFIIKNISKNHKKIGDTNFDILEKYEQFDILLMIQLLNERKSDIDKLIKPNIDYLYIQVMDNYDDDIVRSDKTIIINTLFLDESNLFDEPKEAKAFKSNRKKLLDKLMEKKSNSKKYSKTYFRITSFLNIIYDFFQYMCKLYKRDNEIRVFYEKFDLNEFIDLDEEFLQKLPIKLLENAKLIINTNINENKEIHLEKIDKYISLTNGIEELMDCINNTDDSEVISIELDSENISKINTFIEEYWDTSSRAYYTFFWGQNNEKRILSSGELAMFQMYSRLYSIINIKYETKIIQKVDSKNKNFIILMDEPELYLHPEWQRELINNLINFFKFIYNEYNLQLIISSNTPFLISDLPRENVILLIKKNKDKLNYFIEQDNNEQIGQSFGQNIHTLLEEYFMDFTIGDFAKDKINWIINQLNSTNLKILDNRELIIKTINIIGEPLIKNKLLDMYYSKIDEDKDINEINNEIERLTKMKKILEEKRVKND